MTRIAFVGRQQGVDRSWTYARRGLERGRLAEQAALAACPLLEVVDDPRHADIVQVRLNPEQTSARALRRVMRALADLPAHVRVLNPPSVFRLSAEKHLTFEAWRNAGLSTPDFGMWSLWDSVGSQIERTRALLAGRAGYLRTHNEDSGKGIIVLGGAESDRDLARAVWRLRWRKLINRTSGSRALVTAEVPNRVGPVGVVYRVHLVNGVPFCGYATVGRGRVIHARDATFEDRAALLEANARLARWLQSSLWRSLLARALSALQLDFGAVEFFEVADRPVFLEANPMWGGKHRLGDDAVMDYLRREIVPLDPAPFPLINLWLDARRFYDRYWAAIAGADAAISPPEAPPRTLPAESQPTPPASSASCLPSASQEACASG